MSKRNTIIPAVFVLVRKGDSILLLRRSNTGWSDGDYTLPAGHVEYGESLQASAARELMEEVGLSVDVDKLTLVHVVSHPSQDEPTDRVDVYFEAEDWSGEVVNNEPHKCDDVQWFALDSLPPNVVGTTALALKQLADGRSYSEFGF